MRTVVNSVGGYRQGL